MNEHLDFVTMCCGGDFKRIKTEGGTCPQCLACGKSCSLTSMGSFMREHPEMVDVIEEDESHEV